MDGGLQRAAAGAAAPSRRPGAAGGRSWLGTLWRSPKLARDAALVALTAVGMAVGLVASWLDAPPAVATTGWTVAYLCGGWSGLVGSLEALRRRRVDIDLLMILAALGALAIGAPFEGAMLLFLFSLSNVLQEYAAGRSRSAIEALMALRPETVLLRVDGRWRAVALEEAPVGGLYRVDPGDRLPLDGVIARGRAEVDQAALTGESVPVPKGPGDEVLAGTINGDGSLEVEIVRPASESALARMIALVEEAQSERAHTQRFVDRWEQPYVLAILALTALAVAVPIALIGEPFDDAFYRAMTLMVAASPCALVIATPAAMLSAIAAAARQGVLFKGGVHVEEAAAIRAVAFDKTGTLTEGRTRLVALELLPAGEALGETGVLALAAAVQARSEHHLARATVEAAGARGVAVPPSADFRAVVGQGVRARAAVDGGAPASVHVGNLRYFGAGSGPRLEGEEPALRAAMERHQEEGRTVVLVAREPASERADAAAAGGALEPLALLAFADTLRPSARAVVQELERLGAREVVMLTGDNQGVARRIAAEAGLTAVRSDLLPEQKVEAVRELLHRHGAVAMVGDGVNDAPALAAATLGVAMGAAGTDVALETADVVLMSDDLERVPYLLDLSRRARRVLLQNLGFALLMIVAMVVSILTVGLPLPLAVLGHEGSTVLVALNGLRLLRDPRGARPG